MFPASQTRMKSLWLLGDVYTVKILGAAIVEDILAIAVQHIPLVLHQQARTRQMFDGAT